MLGTQRFNKSRPFKILKPEAQICFITLALFSNYFDIMNFIMFTFLYKLITSLYISLLVNVIIYISTPNPDGDLQIKD